MAARRKKKAKSGLLSGAKGALLVSLIFAAGVAGGYCWRSYAPLPLGEGSPLTDGAASSAPLPDELRAELKHSNSKLAKAQEEAEALRKRLAKLEEVQEQAEEDLADIQIKSILVNN